MRRPGAETALRVGAGAVAVAGLAVAGYLTAVRAAGHSPTCVVGGGCATVQESAYAELVGAPVAVLGVLAYLGFLVAALIPGQLGRGLGLFVGIVGAGFSSWLTWVELVVIGAVCPWCITSAALMLLSLVLAVARVVVTSPPGRTRPRSVGDTARSAHP